MGFRKIPDERFPEPPDGTPECAASLIHGGRPEHPAIDETEFPAIDVYETPAELVVEAELPGIDANRIVVSAGDGLVLLEGIKEEEPGPGRVNFLCMERTFGAFRRAVLMQCAVDITRASAAYREGVLQVRVPKIEEKRGRSRVIPVTTDKPTREGNAT